MQRLCQARHNFKKPRHLQFCPLESCGMGAAKRPSADAITQRQTQNLEGYDATKKDMAGDEQGRAA